MLLSSDTSFRPCSSLDFVLPPPLYLDPGELLYFFLSFESSLLNLPWEEFFGWFALRNAQGRGGVWSIIIATPLVVYIKLSGKTKSAWLCNKTTKSNNNGNEAWRGVHRADSARGRGENAAIVKMKLQGSACWWCVITQPPNVKMSWSTFSRSPLREWWRRRRRKRREKSGVSDLPLFDSHRRHRRCFGLQSTFSRCAVSKGAGAEAVSWLSLDSYQRDSSSGTRAGLKNLRATSGVVERRA